MNKEGKVRAAVRWGLYPVFWMWVLASLTYVLQLDIDKRPAWIVITLPILIVCLVVELTLPMEQRWSMSWRNLFPDLAYIAMASASLGLVAMVLGFFSISLSETATGPARNWPLWLQVPVLFLIFEFMNYHIHRAMHELRGPAGNVLWRIHAAHHLPEGLYLLMHAVSHPLNAMIIQCFAIILPIWFMGYQPDAVLVFLVVNAFHGIISHFNADIRMGYANYIFVGPEVHRYHHSADITEARNYGAILTIWDQLFGTFVYRPASAPANLGVSPEAALPDYRHVAQVMSLPFRK